MGILDPLPRTIKTLARAPVATDDSTKGYVINSQVFDTDRNTIWTAIDVTANAAKWMPTKQKRYVPAGNRHRHMSQKSNTQMVGSKVTHRNGNVAVSNLVLVLPWWYVTSSNVETAIGNTGTVTASIEYPAGTFNQVKKNGSASISIPDLSTVMSDPMGITIPANAQYWVHVHADGGSGGFYPYGMPTKTGLGDGFENGASVTDKTMVGGELTSGFFTTYSALAVLGEPQEWAPAYIFVGDSITAGFHEMDTAAHSNAGGDADANYGALERLIGGAGYGYINLGAPSTTTAQWNTTNGLRLRQELLRDVGTHMVNALGRNSWGAGVSAASMLTDMNAVNTLFHEMGLKVFGGTNLPNTTSSDSWATLGNQTIGVRESIRLQHNANFASGAFSYQAAYLDLSLYAADAATGKWRVDLGQPTDDGTHPLAVIFAAIAAGVSINTIL